MIRDRQPGQINGSASGRDDIGPDLLQRYDVTGLGGLDGEGDVTATNSTGEGQGTQIIVLVNFVFIVFASFCLIFLVLAFFDFSLLSCHFWPFTEVLRKILGSLTRESLGIFQESRINAVTRMEANP